MVKRWQVEAETKHAESDTRLDAKRNPLELLRLSAAQSASLCPAWAQSGAQPYVSREV